MTFQSFLLVPVSHKSFRIAIVAVVDSGVDYTHRDLDDNIWQNAGEIPNNGIDERRSQRVYR